MKANILDIIPDTYNCADVVRQSSKHLGSSPIMGSSLPKPSLSDDYTETAVELGSKAKPEDCARCIGRKICKIYKGAPASRVNPLFETHTNIITSDTPTGELYKRLEEQSKRFNEISEAQQRQEELAKAELSRGISPKRLEDLGLPEVDHPETKETLLAS